jgi:hypothetical protein
VSRLGYDPRVTGQPDADALARRSLVGTCALWSLDVVPLTTEAGKLVAT